MMKQIMMMKKTRIWRLLLLSAWMLPMLVACSSDNGNYDGSSDAVKNRRITRIVNEIIVSRIFCKRSSFFLKTTLKGLWVQKKSVSLQRL